MTPEFQARALAISEAHLAGSVPGGMRTIIKTVSDATGVPVAEVMGDSRRASISQARQLVMFECSAAGYSASRIARALRRDHTTVLHGIQAEKLRRAPR